MKYLTFKELKKEINGYGFNYSFKNYILTILAVLVLTVAAGLFYGLWLPFMLAVTGGCVLCVPFIIRSQFTFLYKQRQFNEVDVYLHQMVYSFQKTGKICVALEDTARIAEGELKQHIEKALSALWSSHTEGVYEEALGIIEAAYPCDRIKTLHKYLISVERNGGRYQSALSVLLQDFDRWIKRVYKRQQDIKKVKTEAGVGVGLCFLVGSASVLVSQIVGGSASINMDITGQLAYQVVSAAFFLACVLYFTYVQLHYKGDWLGKERTDEQILKDYNLCFHISTRQLRLKSLPILFIFMGVAVVMFILNKPLYSVIGIVLLVMAVWTLFIPELDKRAARARLTEDIYTGFSEWLRDIAIHLQETTLQAAIMDSYENSPVIMRQELEDFISDIRENPSDVTPYYKFMKRFNILDVQSTVKNLYAFTEINNDDVDATINALIDRNYVMVDKHEELKERDADSLRRFSLNIPSLFVAFKIAMDMLLMLNTFI